MLNRRRAKFKDLYGVDHVDVNHSRMANISDLVNCLLKELNLEEPLGENEIINNWPKIAGKTIASRTESVFIKKDVLFLKLTSAALRQQLKYAEKDIINKINASTGRKAINRIVLL